MRVIKFSHFYSKAPPGYSKSKLLEVFITDRDDLHSEFVEYDTAINGGGNYPLPSGKLIVLLLQASQLMRLWTTTRRWTPEKERYYRGLRGEIVKCEIVPAGG